MTTIFDQRGQHVTYQYNAYGNINLGAVENPADLREELKKLQAELHQAIEKQAVTGEPAEDARHHLAKAVIEAEKPAPDKKKLSDHLATAKSAIEGIVAVAGLITALSKAAELVQKLL